MIDDKQHQQSCVENQKQSIESLKRRFDQCKINDTEMKDQASIKSDNQRLQRSNLKLSKLNKVMRSWSLQKNMLFLEFLVENRESFERELLRQKHKIFYLMAKRIKLPVFSVCCRRFYQLYETCNSDLDKIIHQLSEFIWREQRKNDGKVERNSLLAGGLPDFNEVQTDSQSYKMISNHLKSVRLMQESMEEICYK